MEADVSWKKFFRDDERYADVINGIGCGGQQLVTGEDLQEADTQTVLGTMYSNRLGTDGRNRKKAHGTRIRDAVRKVAFGVNFVIVGIENQELVDYSIPLRCMVYDAGEYEKQASKVRKTFRKQKKGLTAGELLYGFGKSSRLYPVVTFILYGGKEKWDGPTTLHGMLDFTDLPEKLKQFIPDYSINLVEIREWTDTGVFKTDVKQVFDFIRCSGNKNELLELVQNDDCFRSMDEDAYEVATKYVKAEELIQVKNDYRGEDGKVDMCQALKELIEDGRSEGRIEGREESIRKIVMNMVNKGRNDEEIMELTECSVELIYEVRESTK